MWSGIPSLCPDWKFEWHDSGFIEGAEHCEAVELRLCSKLSREPREK